MRNAIVSGITPRKSLVVPCPFVHFSLHANGGSDTEVAYERRLPGESSVSTGTHTLTNGASGDWAVTGEVEPQGTSGVLLDDQSYDSLFAISDATYQIIYLARYNVTTTPSDKEFVLQFGSRARNEPGGIAFFVNTNLAGVNFFPADTNTDGAGAQKAMSGAGVFSHCGVIDVVNDEIYSAVDGDFGSAEVGNVSNVISAAIAAGTSPQSTSGLQAFSFLASHNGAGDTLQEHTNSGTGQVGVSDVWAFRTARDDSGIISALFSEFTDNPREPRFLTFRNMGTG